MTQKMGRVVAVIGIAGFFAGLAFVAYLNSQIGTFPLEPDYAHGYLFLESAGRGGGMHYVPYSLHRIVAIGQYAPLASFVVMCIGKYFENAKTDNG